MSSEAAKPTAKLRKLEGHWSVWVWGEKKGKPRFRKVDEQYVSPDLLEVLRDQQSTLDASSAAEGDEVEVDYDGKPSSPRRIRFRSKPFLGEAQVATPPQGLPNPNTNRFLNPYNFVQSHRHTEGPLGDSSSPTHARYIEDAWSGVIGATLTTETPLLNLDDASYSVRNIGHGKYHKTYGVRTDEHGRPVLPVTSVKGALRSVVEAITGSRFGVWSSEWNIPLAHREDTRKSADLVPIRVTGADGQLRAEIYHGHRQSVPSYGTPMAAAWLPTYAEPRLRVDDRLPNHGEPLWAELRLVRHQRWDRNQHHVTCLMWRATKLSATQEGLQNVEGVAVHTDRRNGHNWYELVDSVAPRVEQGIAIVTGRSFGRKHDERFAFGRTTTADIEIEQARGYTAVIRSYATARTNGNTIPKGFGAGIHNVEGTPDELVDGDLAFAELNANGKIVRITPVHIGRSPWSISPRDLAQTQDLLPSTTPDRLSPADRIFGWVNSEGTGARKGHLRVHSVACTSSGSDAVLDFPEALPLAILSKPKPTQGRFYVARDVDGDPIPIDTQLDDLYKSGRGLRGRKFYWHHARAAEEDGYWEPGGPFQHPEGEATDQNRSISQWVKPGTQFRVNIHVDNLSTEELGAVLWALSEQHGGRLRLGFGKPLGFGSAAVALDHDATDLYSSSLGGDPWKARYTSLDAAPVPADASILGEVIGVFEAAATSDSLDNYRSLMEGSKSMRVHYPRLAPSIEGADKSYKWFVANERGIGKGDRKRQPLRLPLPLPTKPEDAGTPYSPTRP